MGRRYSPDEIVGQKFGKWTVIEYLGRDKTKDMLFKCVCECGREQNVRRFVLTNGLSTQCKSCRTKKHGYCYTRLYTVWKAMIKRCHNENDKDYKGYGKRGITVCDEWKNAFMSFHDWAYSTGYDENAERGKCTIDRIDVNGNYEPSNCRWVTTREQNINKRKLSINITGYTGVQLKYNKYWIADIGINYKDIYLGSYKTQKEALKARNDYIETNRLPYKIQEYRGELMIINDEQRKVQAEWEKEHADN